MLLFTLLLPKTASARTDAIGDFVVVWADDADGNTVYEIKMRGLNANRSQAFSQRTANAVSDGQQRSPSVAVDDRGNFVVAWQDDQDGNGSYEVLARGFYADGSERFPPFVVNTTSAGDQLTPKIAMTGDGDFVVAWLDDQDRDNDPEKVLARGFNRNGTERIGTTEVAATSDGEFLNIAIAMGELKSFVIVWQDDRDGNGAYNIYARTYSSVGGAFTSDFRVNADAAGQQRRPDVAMDDAGNFVVTWEDDLDGNNAYQILARGYNQVGNQQIDTFTVNTNSAGQQLDPSIAMDAAGNFVVTWEDDQDGNDSYQILARGFNADGSQRFAFFTVNTIATGQQEEPIIAMDAGGSFVIAWEDDQNGDGAYQILARGFNADGSQRFAFFTVNTVAAGQQTVPAIAMIRKDRAFIPVAITPP